MTQLQQIEKEIQKLSPREMAKLRDWFWELDWLQWDAQIERDAAAGKLDKLFANARAEHRAGKSRAL
jgi:hypothetical protein